MKVKTEGFAGSIHKRARIFSDDPKKPNVSVSIKAKVAPIISVKPRSVRLRGFSGDKIGTEITIRAHEEKPLILSPGKFSIFDKVDYEIKTVEEGKAYRLVFQNKLTHKGKYRDILQIKTNYPDKPLLKIRVYGNIRGKIQVSPERVRFGRLDIARLKNTKKKELVRSLNVKSVRGDQLKIEKIDYNPDLFEASVREVQVGKIYAIDLKLFVEKMEPGRLSEKITIYTNTKDEPTTVVDVFGYVK